MMSGKCRVGDRVGFRHPWPGGPHDEMTLNIGLCLVWHQEMANFVVLFLN